MMASKVNKIVWGGAMSGAAWAISKFGKKAAQGIKASEVNPEIPAVIEPHRTLGTLTGYITITEQAKDKLNVPMHPTAEGFKVADHSYRDPTTLQLSIVFGVNDGLTLIEIYDKLLTMMDAREPMDVATGKRLHKNMLIVGLSNVTDADNERLLRIDVDLQELVIVKTQTTTVPGRPKNAQHKGTAKVGGKSAATPEKPLTDRERVAQKLAKLGRDSRRVITGTK